MRVAAMVVLALAAADARSAACADEAASDGRGKLSDTLHRVAVAAEAGRPLPMRGKAFVHGATGRVSAVLDLEPGATVDDVRRSVTDAGGEIRAASDGRVRVVVPARNLRSLARDRHVKRVREPYYPSEKNKVASAAPHGAGGEGAPSR